MRRAGDMRRELYQGEQLAAIDPTNSRARQAGPRPLTTDPR